MFTDLFSQEFSKTIKTANRLGFSLIWDKTNGRLEFSLKFHSRTKFVTKYIYLYTFYLFVQTIRHKCMPNSPHFNLLLVIWYAWMGMCVGVYTLADRPKEVARYWNGMFLLSVKIHGTFKQPLKRRTRSLVQTHIYFKRAAEIERVQMNG